MSDPDRRKAVNKAMGVGKDNKDLRMKSSEHREQHCLKHFLREQKCPVSVPTNVRATSHMGPLST